MKKKTARKNSFARVDHRSVKSSVSLRIVTECFCSSRSKLTPHGPVRDFLSVHLHSAERYSAQQVILSKQVKTRKTVGVIFSLIFCSVGWQRAIFRIRDSAKNSGRSLIFQVAR